MTIEQLQSQIDLLQAELNKLRNTTTIPFDVEQSFRTRLKINELARLAPSAKNPSTETQIVNEAGIATYSVSKPPDGFREFVVGGSTLYIPYYT